MSGSIILSTDDPNGPIELHQTADEEGKLIYYLVQECDDTRSPLYGRFRESECDNPSTLIADEKHRSVVWLPWHGEGICDNTFDESYQCCLPIGHEGPL